jgi:chromosome segregation ATPase
MVNVTMYMRESLSSGITSTKTDDNALHHGTHHEQRTSMRFTRENAALAEQLELSDHSASRASRDLADAKPELQLATKKLTALARQHSDIQSSMAQFEAEVRNVTHRLRRAESESRAKTAAHRDDCWLADALAHNGQLHRSVDTLQQDRNSFAESLAAEEAIAIVVRWLITSKKSRHSSPPRRNTTATDDRARGAWEHNSRFARG